MGGVAALLTAGAARPTDRRAAIVDGFAREQGLNGIVAHGTHGRCDFIRAFGYADARAQRLITPVTRFALGSASKLLTTVAVLRLVEQGRLDLDRPITAWLPDFRADTGARVTLRRLLSNTSGIPDQLNAAVGTDPALRASTEGSAPMVARYAGGDLAFAPGQGWDYALLNWVIVHAILEGVTGQPFAAVLDRFVFRPLAMRHTGLVDTIGGRSAEVASAYSSPAFTTSKMAAVPPFAAASGNVFATAGDAIRAAHGVFATSLLSKGMRRELTTVQWQPEDYALGGRVRLINGRRWAWEPGKTQGYRALIAQELEGDRTIVIFNNTDMAQATIAMLAEALTAT